MMRRAHCSSKRLARPYEVQYETTVKTILRLEEEDERGVTTIREKEQFSHALNLLFADGRIPTLTADAPADEEETSNPKGKADPSVSVEAPPARRRKFLVNEDV